jgi:hypothetical protein
MWQLAIIYSITGKTLTINPTNNLFISTQYFVTLEPGSIKDLAGNSNAEIQPYSFTTSSLIPDTSLNTTVNLDRILIGEKVFIRIYFLIIQNLWIFLVTMLAYIQMVMRLVNKTVIFIFMMGD